VVKKVAKKRTPTKVPHGHLGHKKDGCERCATSDVVLKTIFILLGAAVIAAAYYIGYLVGTG